MPGLPRIRVGRLPRFGLITILLLAVGVTVHPPYDAQGPAIRSDGLGYYAWTEAILQGNLDFCQWSGELNVVGAISSPTAAHPERCQEKYTPGLALLRLPVMGPAALIADHGDARRLTVSHAEETLSLWLGVVALLATMLLLYSTLRRLGVSRLLADGILVLTCFGTGLFHYATFDSSFTHIYSAALFAALTFVGVNASQDGRSPRRLVVFGLSLFIALIREPDIPSLLVLAGAFTLWRTRSAAPGKRLAVGAGLIGPVIAAIVIVGAFQLFYDHWSTGTWTLSSYGQAAFSLGQLKEAAVLFSPNHGLFLWYPVVVVLLIAGLVPRRARTWGLVAMTMVASLTVIYGSWEGGWSLGGAFGLRGFVDIVPVIAFAGGLGLSSLPTRSRRSLLGIAAACTLVTLQLMIGYWKGELAYDHTTGQQYVHQVTAS